MVPLYLLEERGGIGVAGLLRGSGQGLQELDIVGDDLELTSDAVVETLLGRKRLEDLGDGRIAIPGHTSDGGDGLRRE